ncbi:MAG TPA: amidohydrolase family protein [Opitutus sp.]|nr:amidohydrolase family protein [Opitutus sp.]
MRVSFPGLVDLQVNGFAGVDFNSPACAGEPMAQALAAMRATGVTRCLPTIITSSTPHFISCARAILQRPHAGIAGLHMEGPYISPLDGPRGAHPREHVVPASIDDFRRRQDAAGGQIVLVTLAPEVPGALALIEYLVEQRILVALGHTAATAAQIADAVRARARLSTHLGNGCAGQMHRHENVLWPQLSADELTASLIVDGHHLPREVVRSIVKAKGLASVVLVTDAVTAAGAPAGRYQLGELEVERDADGRVTQVGAGNLAGSALTLDDAIGRTARYCGLTLEQVLPMASTQPAALIGIQAAGRVEAEWDPVTHRLVVLQVSDNGSTRA